MRPAYFVLALSLVSSLFVYDRLGSNVESRERSRFERQVREERAAIEQLVPRYEDALMAVRGLFATSSNTTPAQWDLYLANMEIQARHPGMRNLTYSEVVRPEQRAAFLRHIRQNIAPDYEIIPAGDRSLYVPSVYTTFFSSNVPVVTGRDLLTLPGRRSVMEAARDSGCAIASGRVQVMGMPGNPAPDGFVVYMPIYRPNAPVKTVEERRAALQGFVSAGIEPDKMLAGVFSDFTNHLVSLRIFDGFYPRATNLLDEVGAQHGGADREHPRYEQVQHAQFFHRNWTFVFRSTPAFEAESQAYLPNVALLGSLAMSVLLFGITVVQVQARTRAEVAAAKLQRSEGALAVEKERLAVTLNSIAEGVLTTDAAGRLVSLNPMGEQLIGWTQSKAAGKPLGELFSLLREPTRDPCPNPLELVLQTGEPAEPREPCILVNREGMERPIEIAASPMHNKSGGVAGAVLVLRDVTARRKSEAEILKERKLESVGLLAGGIAHDFNNILLGIIGNLSLARMNAHSSEKMLERLAGVEKAALRAKELTQQLVMFARGGAPIRRQLQLTPIIKDVVSFLLRGTAVLSDFCVPEELWPVEADEGQLRQVINNMVMNAVQAMPDGGKIEVYAENVEVAEGVLPPVAAGRYVKITLRDYGIGIAPENLPRIFDPYFSTRKHARGLGLASAYSVVRKHEGQITVDSEVGKGSVFRIYLPASRAPEVSTTPDTEQPHLFSQGRVLIMDDEADVLFVVGEMVKAMGYEVDTARDGAEALRKYQAAKEAGQPFSVVIMDLTIPEGMGGKEAIRRLRELDPEARAVVSSGYSFDPVMANYREYGFRGVIPKPYVMEDLARMLREVMGQRIEPAAA